MVPLTFPRSDFASAVGTLGIILLLPVLLALTVFPTPGIDTRELIAWGREFPLVTSFHPPMMTWVGGLTDRLFGASSAVAICVGQGLLAVGLVYFYRILRLVAEIDDAVLFTFIYGTSLYFVFAPLSFALNADILQLTSWPAVIFHILRASQTNQLRHWLAFGVWSALAVLTKYNAVGLFVGIAGSLLLLPAYRKAFLCRGLLLALLVGGLLILPHALAVVEHPGPLTYGLNHFDSEGGLAHRLSSLLELFTGYLTFSMPASLVIAIALWKRYFLFNQNQHDDLSVRSFLILTAIVSHLFVVLLVLVGGLDYIARFTPPYILLSFLALFASLTCTETGKVWLHRRLVPTVLWLYFTTAIVAIVLFSVFFTNSLLQEPTAHAARLIMEDWDRNYSCGPKYFIGGRPHVYGVGIEARRGVVTLDYTAIAGSPWFDKRQLHDQGAIIVDAVSTDDSAFQNRIAGYLPGVRTLDEKRITLPLLRTRKEKTFTFSYRFVAPADCKQQ